MSRSSPSLLSRRSDAPGLAAGLGVWLLATLGCATAQQTVLSDRFLSSAFLSAGLWREVVTCLGGSVSAVGEINTVAPLPWWPIAAINLVGGLFCWLVGAALLAKRQGRRISEMTARWAVAGWKWALLPTVWEMLRLISALSGWQSMQLLLLVTVVYWFAFAGAGFFSGLVGLWIRPAADPAPAGRLRTSGTSIRMVIPRRLWLMMLGFAAVMTAVNWGMWFNLQIPHGDSAMYEEHLWNLTHGKGFRSYLDRNLFLGEHIQVVHLLLLPLHWLWPSHLALELSESLVLAVGAIPVYRLTVLWSGSRTAGVWLAGAYLLASPVQFLDIAVDGKTFRPTTFGMVALLYWLDAAERKRYRSAVVFLLLAWSAKEDYPLATASVAAFWIVQAIWQKRISVKLRTVQPQADPATSSLRSSPGGGGPSLAFSTAVLCGSLAYFLLAVQVLIPWFRGGEVHYVTYYADLGRTPGEVLQTILRSPGRAVQKWWSLQTGLFAASLLLPLGGLALRAWGRLATVLPLFALLALGSITGSVQHHFHAAILPMMIWATAAGVGKLAVTKPISEHRRTHSAGPLQGNSAVDEPRRAVRAAGFAWGCAVLTGLFVARLSPTSLAFWDPHAGFVYWKNACLPDERARRFEVVFQAIPESARVFSTDFIHPRFTHHARSYDYSDFDRESKRELTAPLPGEDYYLVIDTRHRYSRIQQPTDVPELQNRPEDWHLLDLDTAGYFLVLKRVNTKRDASSVP